MLVFENEQILLVFELAVQEPQKDDLNFPASSKKKEYAKQF